MIESSYNQVIGQDLSPLQSLENVIATISLISLNRHIWKCDRDQKYSLENTVEILEVMKMVSGPGRCRQVYVCAGLPYWRDIEKSCFILMAFLCIVNWPSVHIWGKGGRDPTSTPISSNSSRLASSSSPSSSSSSSPSSSFSSSSLLSSLSHHHH